MERISADARRQFTSTEFQDKCLTRSVHLTLAAPENQEINRQVEVTWIELHTIAHSLKEHAGFLEDYIHFTLMYTEDNILLVLPIKDLINVYGYPTTPFKLATGIKPSILNLHVLFCLCIVQKYNAHVGTRAFNMRHQSQDGFCGIFV